MPRTNSGLTATSATTTVEPRGSCKFVLAQELDTRPEQGRQDNRSRGRVIRFPKSSPARRGGGPSGPGGPPQGPVPPSGPEHIDAAIRLIWNLCREGRICFHGAGAIHEALNDLRGRP
jgi:hypothetical protein